MAAPCATLTVLDAATMGAAAGAQAMGISRDGTTLILRSPFGGAPGASYTWDTTAAAGARLITFTGTGFTGFDSVTVLGLSANGDFAVGYKQVGPGSGTLTEAFVRQLAGAPQTLVSSLGATAQINAATSINDDGSVIVGYSAPASSFPSDATRRGQRWQLSGGVYTATLINPLVAGKTITPKGVNSDGSVVVGVATRSNDSPAAFRWTAAGGAVDIGIPGDPQFGGDEATDTSGDGSVVVGQMQGPRVDLGGGIILGTFRAFRWASPFITGLGVIGTVPLTSSVSTGVSTDGSVVVGTSTPNGSPASAFRWLSRTNMQDLNTLMASAGVDMTGKRLISATDVSGDGKTIVGQVAITDTAGTRTEPYIARYDDFTP